MIHAPASPELTGLAGGSLSAAMARRNGKGQPPRPRIEIQSSAAAPDEAAAIAAALERFLWETAPGPRGAEVSRWQQAALREGVEARTGLGSGWGIAPNG